MHKTKKNNLGTWYITYIASSACSRDSRPRDWSRLGAIFKVSISPNISRDSRDWGHYISVFYPFSKVCFFLKFTYFEKATKFCEIFTLLLSYAVPVKYKVKISQKCHPACLIDILVYYIGKSILRRQQNFVKSSPYFCPMQCQSKVRWRFCKIGLLRIYEHEGRVLIFVFLQSDNS